MNKEDYKKIGFGLLGLVSLIIIVIFMYWMNILFFNLATWPLALANIINKIKGPLSESVLLRCFVTAFITLIAYWVYQMTKRPKAGQIIAFIQIIGGIYTVFLCFSSTFENDILYALGLAGGVFLIKDGFSLYNEKYEEEQKGNRKTTL